MSIDPEELKAALRELLSQPVNVTPEQMCAKLYPQYHRDVEQWDPTALRVYARSETHRLQKLRASLLDALDL